MTPPLSNAGRSGAAAVLVAPRRDRRREYGTPPGAPPRDRDGDGGEGDGGGSSPAGDAGGVGPLALALALAGITILFVVLIAAWLFLRRPAPDWRAADATGALNALWLSTACLLASSVAVELAARRAGLRKRQQALRWLVASLVLGLSFLAAQAWVWTGLLHAGLVPSASGRAGVFFVLTGLHALHVLGGLGFLGTLAVFLRRQPVRVSSVRLGAVYWHYMGALWVVLFTLLYFLR